MTSRAVNSADLIHIGEFSGLICTSSLPHRCFYNPLQLLIAWLQFYDEFLRDCGGMKGTGMSCSLLPPISPPCVPSPSTPLHSLVCTKTGNKIMLGRTAEKGNEEVGTTCRRFSQSQNRWG